MIGEKYTMAKKNTRTTDETASPSAAPTRRRAASTRKSAAAPPIDVATVSGIEPIATAADAGAAPPDDPTGTDSREPTYQQIAEAAYYRHLNRGDAGGDQFNDWLEAERELRTRRR